MNPHIEIRTDKPKELLEALDNYRAGVRPLKSELLPMLHKAHFRLVETEHLDFTNYETAMVAISIDHDKEALSSALLGVRKSKLQPSPDRLIEFGPEETWEMDVAEGLKESFHNAAPWHLIPSPYNELMAAGLEAVDWLDLARHYISKVKEGVTV